MFILFFRRDGLNALISSYFWMGAQKDNFERVLEIPPAGRYFRLVDKKVYLDQQDFIKSGKRLFKLAKKEDWELVNHAAEILYGKGGLFLEFCKKLNKTKFEDKTRMETFKIFDDFSKKALDFAPSISFAQTIGPRLEEELKKIIKRHFPDLKKSQQDDMLMLLVQPKKDIITTDEYFDLIEIGEKIQEQDLDLGSKEVSELVDGHLGKYGWISARFWSGQPWQKEDIIRRLENELKTSCKDKIKENKIRVSGQKKFAADTLKKAKFTEKEKKLVDASRENVYLKTYRTDLFTHAGFLARPLFYAIAKRLGLGYEELLCCSFKEIKDFLQGKKINIKDIKQRKEGYAYICTPKIEKVISKKIAEKEKKSSIEQIKGQIAYLGIARGKAKVIKSKSDFQKIEKGDILVCSMTTPDYVPVLERISAIVTDEGGITSHAAIVAREMRKPCVIGTKMATKIFKDGDLIEVDANKGIVRKIKE